MRLSAKLRPWFARFALVVLAPVVLFGALEFGLRVTGVGHPASFFVPDAKPGWVRTNPRFAELFFPPSFGMRAINFRMPIAKRPNTVRVFVLGESAVKGTPEPAFGFASLLQAQLRAAYPSRHVEVWNLGITAINSHVVARIAREAAAYSFDLFVVYLGNNEVVGPYGPGSAYRSNMPPLWLIRVSIALRATRTGQLAESLLHSLARPDRKTSEWRGMQMFADNAVEATDPRLPRVYDNFAANLLDIVASARAGGARVLLSTVVANLKDSAPFISRHAAGLSPEVLARFDTTFRHGLLLWGLGGAAAARRDFTACVALDPAYADAHFMAARTAEAEGDARVAREEYVQALHWDALRFRPDEPINAIIRTVAARSGLGVRLVDTARAFGSTLDSDAPLSGSELLLEHVHFNWNGNCRAAALFAAEAEKLLPSWPEQSRLLSPSECAAVVGYTSEGQLKMLRTIRELVARPPFTGQLTYAEVLGRYATQIARLEAKLADPAVLDSCCAALAAAEHADPENPLLPVLAEDAELDRGHLDAALAAAERAQRLQPDSPELTTQRAYVLNRMHRGAEAESVLLQSIADPPPYFPAMAVLVDVWESTGEFAKGRAFFAEQCRRFPHNTYVRLAYADLCNREGSTGEAVALWRAVQQDNPENEPSLARLAQWFEAKRDMAGELGLRLEATSRQPRNFENNRWLARYFLQTGDTTKAVTFFAAMESSGPVSSTFHVEYARQLAALGRMPEMMVELLLARREAQNEQNTSQLADIDALVAHYRSSVTRALTASP